MSNDRPLVIPSKRKLILFNGPPGVGKDTAAGFVYERRNAHWFRFSQPLKDGIRAFFNLTEAQYRGMEENKNVRTALLFNHSFREVQINMSEEWAKKLWGDAIFGELALRRVDNSAMRIFVCSDSGFDYEVAPLVTRFGRENVLLVKLHRQGHNFKNDSRSYIDLPGVHTVDLQNNSSKAVFREIVDTLVDAWIVKGEEELNRM